MIFSVNTNHYIRHNLSNALVVGTLLFSLAGPTALPLVVTHPCIAQAITGQSACITYTSVVSRSNVESTPKYVSKFLK